MASSAAAVAKPRFGKTAPGVLHLPKSRRYPEHPFGHAWHQEGYFATEVNRSNGFQWIKE